nr:MAG TPA: hypothetical protein [Crassvirales sp.]DAJ71008.1 MAG TPA: hypothetical protein [Caudoviricetes sp.]
MSLCVVLLYTQFSANESALNSYLSEKFNVIEL